MEPVAAAPQNWGFGSQLVLEMRYNSHRLQKPPGLFECDLMAGLNLPLAVNPTRGDADTSGEIEEVQAPSESLGGYYSIRRISGGQLTRLPARSRSLRRASRQLDDVLCLP